MHRKKVLVAGASGVVGNAAIEAFLDGDDWNVVALSRRPPAAAGGRGYEHLALDLMDPDGCANALRRHADVTHVVYAALFEKAGLVKGWRDQEQMQTNLAMLRNLLGALDAAGCRIEHVSLLQGTKAYGAHIHPIAVPARESWPRDPHDNFYWLQEDFLRETSKTRGFGFTIWRPQIVFGDVVGVAMNIIPVIGAYAAICREEGLPFAFPGGPPTLLEAIDARLLGRALRWAAGAPSARNETFNITNGDVFVWQNVWPSIARTFGLEAAVGPRVKLGEHMPEKAGAWKKVAARHGLAIDDLSALLGESHHYADFTFGTYARSENPPPVLVSTVKLRQAGFGDCIDTEDMFRDCFASLADRRIIPPLAASVNAGNGRSQA